MEVRYAPNEEAYKRMTTAELRAAFLFEHLFIPDGLSMVYCDNDRAIVGGAVPVSKPLSLKATRKEMAADFFAERREIGIINIGGEGRVAVDGNSFHLPSKDMLYVGRGAREVSFASAESATPARFYFVSFPAHTTYPTALAHYGDSEQSGLGSMEAANKRTIRRYIHAGGVKSCQLVMGMTELDAGSVWNTMPPHTHQRRTEVYMYFGLRPDALAVHLMGKPDELRCLIVRDQEAVLSPSWSIHSAAATQNYAFVWAMGGENQEFSDMDALTMRELR